MNQMAFNLGGGGLWGLSVGSAFLAIMYNGQRFLYSGWCQGPGTSKVYTKKPFTIENQLEPPNNGDEVLFNFVGAYVVTIEIPDAFVGWGTVDFTFNIEEQESGKARYALKRKPDVKGFSMGSIEITTKFDKHNLCNNSDLALWQTIWDGEIRPIAKTPPRPGYECQK